MSEPENHPQPAQKRQYDPTKRRWVIVNYRTEQNAILMFGDERGAESAAITAHLQTERRQTFYYKPWE